MTDERTVRLAVAAAAGLVAGGAVALTWAALGATGAVVGALVAGAVAGLIAGTRWRAVVAVAFGALPALWIDLFAVPTPPRELGGFVQTAFGVVIASLIGVALLGAVIGVAAARAEELDLIRSARRRVALGIAAVAVVAGWLWFGAVIATSAPT
jgi:hypothetical protein